MKIFWLAAALAGASTAPTLAADLARVPYTKAAPVATQVYNWTGFYAGVNVGIGLGRNLNRETIPDLLIDSSSTAYLGPLGAIGGAQVGFDKQWGDLIVGLEADIQASGQKDRACTMACVPVFSYQVQQQTDWFGTVRGRVGLATGPVLSYVTGGFAYGNVKTGASLFTGTLATINSNETRTGWTVGSGVEAALAGNWTAKLEYLYVDLGTTARLFSNAVGLNAGSFITSDIREHIFRVGVNYRLNGAAAAAAPTADWSGLYVGANAGSATARNSTLTTSVFAPAITPSTFERFMLSPDGYLGGVQLGYNWQTANWVYGIEADVQASSQRDNKSCQLTCAPSRTFFETIDQKTPWLATVRGRLGYAVGPALFYATGGLALGEVSTKVTGFGSFAPITTFSFRDAKAGWTVGAGIESPLRFFDLIGKNWTVKTEYLYADLGHVTNVAVTPTVTMTHTMTIQEHIFRGGINYHFN